MTRGRRSVLPLVCGVLLAFAVQASEAFAASWAPGLEAGLPANAGSIPVAYLNSVSCPAAGNCSAVGSYHDGSANQLGLLLTEAAGTWAPGLQASLRANPGSSPPVRAPTGSAAASGAC